MIRTVWVFMLVFFISVIAHIPASFLLHNMPEVRGLVAEGVQGSLWHGSLQNLSWQDERFGQVQWDFQPGQLWLGKVEFAVQFGRNSELKLQGKGRLGTDLKGFYARQVLVSVPAFHVLQKAELPVPVDISGQLELTVTDYRYGLPWCESATGTLVWSDSELVSPLGTLTPGTFIADMTCQQNQIELSGSQNNRQLSAAFTAILNPDRKYTLEAWFKPGGAFPSSLLAQLTRLGTPDHQGRYPLVYSGRL